MKNLFPAILLVVSLTSSAQKGIDEMIAAEKSFAAYAVANNTVDAFLKFMDTSAVMFENGEAVKGYERWLKKQRRPGILNWRPLYAEIAASGDFGFTCGPWTFQPTAVDSVIRNGYFFTVWKKNDAGEWKFILDVGTDAGQLTKETTVTKLTEEKTRGVEVELKQAEENFIKLFRLDPSKAYKEFASRKVITASPQNPLAITSNHRVAISNKPEFSFKGGGISPGADLGYAFGTVALNGKQDAYLRIWRHEPTGWKIVLQVTRL